MSERVVRRAGVVLLAAGLALGVSACREKEQNRPLVHEKGVYTGKPDQKLGEQTKSELRQRALEIQQY